MMPEQIASIREAIAVEREGLEGVWDRMDTRVVWPRMAERLLDEIAFLTERLDRANADYEACLKSHQKMNAQYERATDLLVDLRGWQLEASGAPKELLDALSTFLDSE